MKTMLLNRVLLLARVPLLAAAPLFMLLGQACKKYQPFTQTPMPEVTINAGDTRLSNNSIHLSKDTVYLLTTSIYRDSGQDLTIDPGTLIKVNDNLSINIRPGATIQAKGTAAAPIVFTSSAITGTAGIGVSGNGVSGHYWNGLWIRGNAGSATPQPSGTLNYVRIEFAGGYANDILAALFLQNVVKGTSIEHVQVSYSSLNTSFEFAGGNCDARYLISYASASSDLYLHMGFTGRIQNVLAYRHPYFPDNQSSYYPGDALAGLLIRDNTSNPYISNLTVVGPDSSTASTKYNAKGVRTGAFIALGGANFHIRNSVFIGFPAAAWYLDDAAVAAAVDNGQADVTHSVFYTSDSTKTFYLKPGTYGGTTSDQFKAFMLQSQFVNQQFLSLNNFLLTDPFNYNAHPDPSPKTGSPLLSGANFDAPFNDDFFTKLDYLGALGTDSWMKDWSNFTPTQSAYND